MPINNPEDLNEFVQKFNDAFELLGDAMNQSLSHIRQALETAMIPMFNDAICIMSELAAWESRVNSLLALGATDETIHQLFIASRSSTLTLDEYLGVAARRLAAGMPIDDMLAAVDA